MAFFLDRSFFIKRVVYRIEDIFKRPVKMPPDSERIFVELPPEGKSISVEMALNSRCTSDYDENPGKFHWGMFDRTKKLSDKQIKEIISLAKIPRFTDLRVEIQSERNILTFVVDNHATGTIKNWVMVESGMQQQAVGLVCTALGVGTVLKNLGENGIPISDADYAAIKMRLDAMKPTYDGSFWSNLPPTGRKSWLKGNLPEPIRDGNRPLISTLASLQIKNMGSQISNMDSVSQLLWAARGRTPHLYKSTPWGMTIPTWGGEQNISSIYLISDNKLSKYINWNKNRPTHSLLKLKEIERNLLQTLRKAFISDNKLIVIGKNEDFDRALWEVGYQLLNILFQAKALDISYEATLLEEEQKNIFKKIGIKNPIAVVSL